MDRNTLILVQKILKRINSNIKLLMTTDSATAYFEIKMLRKFKRMVAIEVKRVHNLDLSAKQVIIEYIPPTNP